MGGRPLRTASQTMIRALLEVGGLRRSAAISASPAITELDDGTGISGRSTENDHPKRSSLVDGIIDGERDLLGDEGTASTADP